MKCIVITYIDSSSLITAIESIMGYYHFKVIENNKCYRVFMGYFNGNIAYLADKLNNELENFELGVEDSMSIVYPLVAADGNASLANVIIKSKGNKYLRKRFLT